MEEMLTLDRIPVFTILGESIPRSPCPSYRRDRGLERNRNYIAHLVVLGMFPWGHAPQDSAYEETLKLFGAFRPFALESYRLHSILARAVQTGWEGVYGAVYASPERALVVLSNTNPDKRKNVVWRVRPEVLALARDNGFRLRDVTSGGVRRITSADLTDGSLTVDLDGYEYRLFEVLATK